MGLPYGFKQFRDYFSPRQLTTAKVLSDCIKAIAKDVETDAASSGLPAAQAQAYAQTVTTFLGLCLSRFVDNNNSLCRWRAPNPALINLFARQAIPMVWDFCEGNSLGEAIGSWHVCLERESNCIETLAVGGEKTGSALQVDASSGHVGNGQVVVSTDPPYYDNIGYAALLDFFYVWLRRTVGHLYPGLFGTLLTPKREELTASPTADRPKDEAKEHFESGFQRAFTALREKIKPGFPLTVYYAFKQEDEEAAPADETDVAFNGVDLTTGWETLLEALVSSGFQITATWPVRASQAWRIVSMGTNALASYIVLACRPRSKDAPQTGRREFMAELKRELPVALRHLQQGNVAPVDFAQAAIGPGMAVFSRFSHVLESSGQSMTVRTALALINQILGEVLTAQEDEFDADTRWALAWFEQKGFAEGEFGDANTLATAKNTAVNGLVDAGILHSGRGKVRLLRPEELDKDWDPATDDRLTVWEMTHHLLRVFYVEKQGEAATAALLRKLGSRAEVARDLGYRLFRVTEKLHSQDAQAYNALVLAWPDLVKLAQVAPGTKLEQEKLL